jgi:hypothetical protein
MTGSDGVSRDGVGPESGGRRGILIVFGNSGKVDPGEIVGVARNNLNSSWLPVASC